MANDAMYKQMSAKLGFIAALDQSGGSTPGALRAYGILDSAWHGDEAEMFGLIAVPLVAAGPARAQTLRRRSPATHEPRRPAASRADDRHPDA